MVISVAIWRVSDPPPLVPFVGQCGHLMCQCGTQMIQLGRLEIQ